MSIDIAELRRLAVAATRGPWLHVSSTSDCCDYEVWQQLQCASLIAGEYGIQEESDAAYIAAANPAALLSLLDELEGLRKDAERYRWLRKQIESGPLVIAKCATWDLESWSGDDPDSVIDAAIRAAEGKGDE